MVSADYTFENAGISLWKEDFSAVWDALQELKLRGVSDFRSYFNDHSEVVRQLIRLVKIVDVNQATLRMFGATQKEALLGSLERIFTSEAESIFIEELMTIVQGKTEYSSEVVLCKLNGERIDVLFSIVFPVGTHLRDVVVSIMDISERKQAENRLRLLQEITTAFSRAVTPTDVAAVIMDRAVRALGGHVGAVVMLDDDGETLHLLSDIGVRREVAAKFRRTTINDGLPLTDAVRDCQPVWIESTLDLTARYPKVAALIANTSRSQAMACLPLIANQRCIGGMSVSFPAPTRFEPHFRRFLTALSDQCAIALERAGLYARAREMAALEERQRLARDLHDAVSQTLFSSTTIAESLPQLIQIAPQRVPEHLNQMVVLNRAAMAEMRTLLLELRPEAIVSVPLPRLLEQLLNAARGRKQIAASLVLEGTNSDLPDELRIALFRIAQEAINNTLKHSRASTLTVHFSQQPDMVMLRIVDDGSGFVLEEASGGMGLNNLRERAAKVGASLTIETAKGSGTSITVIWRNRDAPLSAS
jgi:PAS domain S-box-containing protein